MILGQSLKRAYTYIILGFGLGLLALTPSNAIAQEETPATTEATAEADAAAAGLYTPMGNDQIKGQPVAAEDDFYGSMNVQPQFTDIGQYADGFHIALIWIMAIISVFVLGLLFWVIVRYNKRSNPNPSKTTHNTAIEVIWTLVPVLVLIGIALPSISLLAKQYETPPEDAITVKATGAQWYWEYSFPDYGVEYTSYMLNPAEGDEINNGIRRVGSEPFDGPAQLEVDNRLVVPVGKPLRLQTTAKQVIHSFAVPALWFKLDAVPGRINERLLTINEPGIYYGQCSELCGVKHGYMPIAVEVLPMDKFEDWIRSRGGTVPGDAPVEGEAAETETPAEVADVTEEAPTTETTEAAADAAAAE
ncbi:MAG: cytochrome c oxidase subunit II [Erythrobacter sp.]